MPRNSRRNSLSDSKIYHIIIKGVNGQEVFFEDCDRIKFLKLLKYTKKTYSYDIFAYALMDNHVHLVIHDKEEKISSIMHRICTVYAIYFNKKYQRTGHLFQNRFKSISVNSEKYLLNLQRYVHMNPQKEGICKMEKYNWSSYKEYVNAEEIVNADFILNIFDTNKAKSIQKFVEYNQKYQSNSEQDLEEFEIRENLTDEKAIYEIKKALHIENVMGIMNLNKELRDRSIKKIYQISGISQKQISRILGISVRTIQRAIKEK